MSGGQAAAAKTPEELEAEQQAAAAAADPEAKKKADEEAAAAAAGGTAAGEEGFEVVEEGAHAGADRTVPLAAHRKLREKLKGRVRVASADAEAARSESELLKLENQQLKERLAASQKKPMPKADDYAGKPAEFEAAMDQWIAERATTAVRGAVAQQPAAVASDEGDDQKLTDYAERAAKLKAPDFDQAEDTVIDALGPQATQHIMKKFGNSEAVIYALGKNPGKLGEIAKQLKSDPVGAIVNLTQYAGKLTLKPRKAAPDPNPASRGSAPLAGDAQQQLDKMRDLRDQGKATMREVLDLKKKLETEGHRVT